MGMLGYIPFSVLGTGSFQAGPTMFLSSKRRTFKNCYNFLCPRYLDLHIERYRLRRPYRRPTGQFEEVDISHDFDLYSRFLNSFEPQADVIVSEWIKSRSREYDQSDVAEEKFFGDDYYEEWGTQVRLKGILMNTFFAGAYALFEYHLIKICKLAQRRRNFPLSLKDLRRPILESVQKYLKGLDGISLTNTKEWPRIKKYSDIRNRIMHSGGYIVGQNSDFDNFAEAHGIVSHELISGPSLELTPEFCRKALDDFERFLIEANRVNL